MRRLPPRCTRRRVFPNRNSRAARHACARCSIPNRRPCHVCSQPRDPGRRAARPAAGRAAGRRMDAAARALAAFAGAAVRVAPLRAARRAGGGAGRISSSCARHLHRACDRCARRRIFIHEWHAGSTNPQCTKCGESTRSARALQQRHRRWNTGCAKPAAKPRRCKARTWPPRPRSRISSASSTWNWLRRGRCGHRRFGNAASACSRICGAALFQLPPRGGRPTGRVLANRLRKPHAEEIVYNSTPRRDSHCPSPRTPINQNRPSRRRAMPRKARARPRRRRAPMRKPHARRPRARVPTRSASSSRCAARRASCRARWRICR